MSRRTRFSTEEAVEFSAKAIRLLNNYGFLVDSLTDAISCVEGLCQCVNEVETAQEMSRRNVQKHK